jgi:hypothetical protein
VAAASANSLSRLRLELPAALAMLDGTRWDADCGAVRRQVLRDDCAGANDRPFANTHAFDGGDTAADLAAGAQLDATRKIRCGRHCRKIAESAIVAHVADTIDRDERADVNVHGQHRSGGDRGAWSDLEPATEPDARVNGRDESMSVAADAGDNASLCDGAPDTKCDARIRAFGTEPIDSAEDGESVDLASVHCGVVVDESEDVPSCAVRVDVFDQLDGFATVSASAVHDDRVNPVAINISHVVSLIRVTDCDTVT